MPLVITGIKLLAFCIAMGGTGALLCRKRFGEILPLTFAAAALIQIPLGIVTGSLTAGYVVCALWAIAFVPLCVYYLAIRRDRERISDNLLTPGFFAVCIICFIVTIMDVNAAYADWDEYSHWGPMVRVLFQENRLYSPSPLSFAHHDYPPAAQLFEVLVCRFLGELKDEHVYRALQIFTLSVVLPLTEISGDSGCGNGKYRFPVRILHAAYGVMFLLMAFMVVKPHLSLFDSIYLDLLLAVEGGMLLFRAWDYDGSLYSALTIEILGALVLMTKQLGLVFVLLAFLILVIRGIIYRIACNSTEIREEQKLRQDEARYCHGSTSAETHPGRKPGEDEAKRFKKSAGTGVLHYCVIAGLPAAFTIMWRAYIAYLHLGGQFELSKLVENAAAVLTGNGFSAFQTKVIGVFLNSVLHLPLNLQSTSTYAGQLVIFLFLSAAFSLFLQKHNRKRLPEVLAAIAVLLAGFVLHACVLLGLYLFGGFSEFEAETAASFQRYMGTYTFAVFIALAAIVLTCLNDLYLPAQRLRIVLLPAVPLALLCGIFYVLFLGTCIGRYDLGELNNIRPHRWGEISAIYGQSRKLLETTGNEGNVLILSQDDNGQKGLEFSYFMSPYPVSWINLGKTDDEDVWRTDLPAGQLCGMLKRYEYFYVYHTDEIFDRDYAGVIGMNGGPKDGDLYRVDTDSGHLEWIANMAE